MGHMKTIRDLGGRIYIQDQDKQGWTAYDAETIAPLNIIKDSGTRREFASGAVRDIQEGKGRLDLLPACAILRVARHFEAGAKKYDDRNWEKGIPVHSFIDSALRHLMKYLDGQDDEDHLCAAAWNCLCAMWTEEKRPDLQDIPARRTQNNEAEEAKNPEGDS